MKQIYSLLILSFCYLQAFSQEPNYGQVSGNFALDAQYYIADSTINAQNVPEKTRMNTFANINYTLGKFSTGFRYEAYMKPLLGFLPGWEGQGIMYRYAQFTDDKFDVTIGSFYEQFGSGMILRAYEERALGYDNMFDGARVKFNPYKGVYLKGLYGKQRLFWRLADGVVRGADAEVNLNEMLDSVMGRMKTKFILGASFVSRYQNPADVNYVMPANVGSFATRLNIIRDKWNVSGEYVYKINDPSADNKFIYKNGQGLLLQFNYATKGFGLSLSGKYIDNMSFRSDRYEGFTNVFINFNPALTRPHTYNLAATLYPYACQPTGEIAFQGELNYKFQKGTLLGGKYGANLAVNYSYANGLDTTTFSPEKDSARMGYSSRFFGPGSNKYFRDFNIEFRKKVSDKFKFVLMYIYLEYDMEIVQNLIGKGTIYSHIGVADLNYKIDKKNNIRVEVQHLYTQQDKGSWATVLVEYTRSPHWFIGALSQYNYGNEVEAQRVNYPYLTVGYIQNSTRITMGYGKQREGLFCVGGVCRAVPASNGFTLSITSSF
ncbi:MAG TPA: hypothetical protein DEP18_05375 [Flavobacteriales bacterium]|nr:hypothetical protein [Flavobacteriales bacterium]HRE73428.1 DUF6029 family protein [Flavobacteriales bacterium]HRJ38877.1 DUF6029 family protein [Flavobacteriales bacterium]